SKRDWSSDVCSSDVAGGSPLVPPCNLVNSKGSIVLIGEVAVTSADSSPASTSTLLGTSPSALSCSKDTIPLKAVCFSKSPKTALTYTALSLMSTSDALSNLLDSKFLSPKGDNLASKSGN